ncbi:uncharacterized protein FIBRA_06060 [Fibroporia radiculosa]|uniref:SGNH hydrolase-type esterase domain-containing protein n=1 Tax=Fibroporia radiculosa TaxID=599839 RepID=J4H3V6_9APHY|nr:uncharacterized protein FIBRA_06060 [Fibroporia radiculosa]CCM03909.1 predicted protein [Fibroporia radiculosa]
MSASIQDAIMLLGDSLTQGGWEAHGFAQRLAFAYNRKLDVINRGMSGYNTEWIIPVFEQCFATQNEQQHVPKVRLLTIWLGANDAATEGTPQYVPLPAYSANLAKLVRTVTDSASAHYSPVTRILLLTPPPVNTHQWAAHRAEQNQTLDRNFEKTRTYAQAVRDVGKQVGVPVVDLWTALWDACGHVEEQLSEYLSDGLHLTDRGYAIVFDEIMKSVSENYPELHYDKLPPVFELWDKINLENPLSSLSKRDIFSSA